jgi:hypothetical protein
MKLSRIDVDSVTAVELSLFLHSVRRIGKICSFPLMALGALSLVVFSVENHEPKGLAKSADNAVLQVGPWTVQKRSLIGERS